MPSDARFQILFSRFTCATIRELPPDSRCQAYGGRVGRGCARARCALRGWLGSCCWAEQWHRAGQCSSCVPSRAAPLDLVGAG